jgi:hypothetical protein
LIEITRDADLSVLKKYGAGLPKEGPLFCYTARNGDEPLCSCTYKVGGGFIELMDIYAADGDTLRFLADGVIRAVLNGADLLGIGDVYCENEAMFRFLKPLAFSPDAACDKKNRWRLKLKGFFTDRESDL